MVTRKELINREYSGKDCMAFMYDIEIEINNMPATVRTYFIRLDEISWEMSCHFRGNGISETQTYRLIFRLGSSKIPLETICMTGLIHLKNALNEEMNIKSKINMAIYDVVNIDGGIMA